MTDIPVITNAEREQIRTRGSLAIPDPYGLLDKYEAYVKQLEQALANLAPEIESEIERREEQPGPDDRYAQLLVEPWERVLAALGGL